MLRNIPRKLNSGRRRHGMEQAAITNGIFTYLLVLKEAKTSQLVLPNLEYLWKSQSCRNDQKMPSQWGLGMHFWYLGQRQDELAPGFFFWLMFAMTVTPRFPRAEAMLIHLSSHKPFCRAWGFVKSQRGLWVTKWIDFERTFGCPFQKKVKTSFVTSNHVK